MNKKQKDIVCDVWLKVFGVQEGVGMNCPAEAYKFAELILKAAEELQPGRKK